jgi:hypothetical protein
MSAQLTERAKRVNVSCMREFIPKVASGFRKKTAKRNTFGIGNRNIPAPADLLRKSIRRDTADT